MGLRPVRRHGRCGRTWASGGEVLDALCQRIQPDARGRRCGGWLQVGAYEEGENGRIAAQRSGVGEGPYEGGDQGPRGAAAEVGTPITVSGSPGSVLVTNQLSGHGPTRSTRRRLSRGDAARSECSSQSADYRISKGSSTAVRGRRR
ncbi:hypothetical protein ABZ848_27825 [Streptomyces sp. NPDC047081]|uniref:hypothetical protein n=1 Tax=Streptomyces sp. NPDC047081 TaxID=3154706 RepID=UPI0033ECEA1B